MASCRVTRLNSGSAIALMSLDVSPGSPAVACSALFAAIDWLASLLADCPWNCGSHLPASWSAARTMNASRAVSVCLSTEMTRSLSRRRVLMYVSQIAAAQDAVSRTCATRGYGLSFTPHLPQMDGAAFAAHSLRFLLNPISPQTLHNVIRMARDVLRDTTKRLAK